MFRRLLPCALLLVAALPLTAQKAVKKPEAAAEDTLSDDQAEEGRPGIQYGVAAGGLQYGSSRSEQVLGAIVRWVPVRWFSLSGTPAMVRVNEPATRTTRAFSQSGLVDLPVEGIISHGFGGLFNPTLSGGVGVTLPVGDTAGGFGAGRAAYSATAGLGLAPTSQIWTHLSVGRSLGSVAVQSAFTSASGWGDFSVGTNVTEQLGVSAGYSSDVGTIDPAVGRSTSLSGGVSYSVSGPTMLNFTTSRGLSGAAPRWSLGLGFGTAFPYLNHLGSGGSSLGTLNRTHGAGTTAPRRRGRP
jgi:hypothetical protein